MTKNKLTLADHNKSYLIKKKVINSERMKVGKSARISLQLVMQLRNLMVMRLNQL